VIDWMSQGAARVLVCAIVALSLLTACRPSSDGIVAERLHAVLTVLVDGSIDVEEQWSVRFESSAATAFARAVPVSRHDGAFAVEGTIDGRPSAKGRGPGQLLVAKGPALDARWTLAPPTPGAHSFVLRYRMAGAVEVSGIRGVVSSRVLAPRSYDIEAADLTLKLPAGAVFLGDPWVEEAGWTVERRLDEVFASRRNVARNEWATIGATFTIDTMSAGEPAWQYHERRASDLMPAFVSAGLFLLVIGAGVVGMLRLKHPPARARPGAPVEASAAITPAMALALERGQSRGDMAELRATAAGLDAPGRDLTAGKLMAHERVLADERWYQKDANTSTSALPARQRKRFRAALLQDLIDAGLVDAERVSAVRDLRRAGVVTLLFGALTWIVASVAFDQFGLWPLSIPIGMLASGLMFVFAAPRLPILSQNGVEARGRVLYSARVRNGRTSA
jgi:hypothetical protein